jgi:S1-C subfamily serine protease
VVVFLQPGGAAEQSGVLIGDVWVEIQSQSVSDVADLQALTGSLPAGRALEIVSVRANDRNTMRITPELKPAE